MNNRGEEFVNVACMDIKYLSVFHDAEIAKLRFMYKNKVNMLTKEFFITSDKYVELSESKCYCYDSRYLLSIDTLKIVGNPSIREVLLTYNNNIIDTKNLIFNNSNEETVKFILDLVYPTKLKYVECSKKLLVYVFCLLFKFPHTIIKVKLTDDTYADSEFNTLLCIPTSIIKGNIYELFDKPHKSSKDKLKDYMYLFSDNIKKIF
jgi:hypothetical protein